MRRGARRAVIAAVAVVSAANVAVAEDDSGVHAFLSNFFGQGGGAIVAPSVPAPAFATERVSRARTARHWASSRPLTVHRQQPRMVAAVGPTKPAKVSIYDDRTLRPGDAVMTATGVRIFAGSTSWPYTKADFVTIAAAKDLSRETVKVLAGLDSLPRT